MIVGKNIYDKSFNDKSGVRNGINFLIRILLKERWIGGEESGGCIIYLGIFLFFKVLSILYCFYNLKKCNLKFVISRILWLFVNWLDCIFLRYVIISSFYV